MRFSLLLLPSLALVFLTAACRPDQVEHLENGQAIDREAENWKPKRILPNQLLAAAHWAGDSLTRTADRAWRAQLTERLRAGGVEAAHPFCQPEKLPQVVGLARELDATTTRQLLAPRFITEADTVQVLRPTADEYVFQQPLVILPNDVCLKCHGQVGTDISAADAQLLTTTYPSKKLTGYQPGQLIGFWKISLTRRGVAAHYTMKTRKVFKRRF
ncbi:c-type heme family protein [Hymenobacter koreensis]|uniref:Tll0287-like domain-containing protein n=1 Tax=Hymenobacter koreensis TaxID=1084523 RepID=A0ABP8JH16_9BACT